MAARLLCTGERTVAARNLKTLCGGQRAFSSKGHNDNKDTAAPPDIKEVSGEPDTANTWLDIKAGIFGPSDDRMPMPGNVGFSYGIGEPKLRIVNSKSSTRQVHISIDPKFLPGIGKSIAENQDALGNIVDPETKEAAMQKMDALFKQLVPVCDKEASNDMAEDIETNTMPDAEDLELKVMKCPNLVKKDFLRLFSGFDNNSLFTLNLLTVRQKTHNDMSIWSEEMEDEREEKLKKFIYAAKKICKNIKESGHWADFIEPFSGRPYYGAYTNDTLFDTDERFRYFGLQIEDLGCCKVISHGEWGTNVIIGAIFTSAPAESLDMHSLKWIGYSS